MTRRTRPRPRDGGVRLASMLLAAAALAGCRHGDDRASDQAMAQATRDEHVAAEAVIYENARVITMDPARPRAGGLRIEGGRITHVFDDPPERSTGRRVDLGGAVVLPGLVDAHLHLQGLGRSDAELDLRGADGPAAVAEAVAGAAAGAPPGTWIRGRGWDQNRWPGGAFPTHMELDAASPDHPVWLARVDGHAVWLNGRALALAGLTAATPDPPGGELLRFADGRPTGVLVDNAIDLAQARLPRPGPDDIRRDLERAFARLARAGLTGAHDMGTTPEVLAVLEALDAAGRLPVRVTAYLQGSEAELAPLLAAPPRREGRLRVVGVKLFADGALGSRGAALLEPYSDRPDTRGLLLTPAETLAARVAAIHRAGWQAAVHAIGDRGNRVALDAIEAALRTHGPGRHRLEHAQVLHPSDLRRLAALDVVASYQPVHATSDMGWVDERLGEARLAGAYAWRSVRDSGAVLAFGSDAPVELENPWHGLHAAVTRQDADGFPDGGWRPEERLPVPDALAGFTSGAARAVGDPDLGVIRPGARADLTVVDRDPEAVAPAALRDTVTLRTVVDGQEVFRSGGPRPADGDQSIER